MIYIYALADPKTNEVRYIGKSFRVKERYRDHLNDKSKTHKVNWIQSLIKKNLKPTLVILETLNDEDDWQSAEIRWIKNAKDAGWKLVNGTSGGDGVKNLSPDAKLRMLNGWKGRKHSPETIAKYSEQRKGRKHTAEFKTNMSKIMKGRKITWMDKVKESLRKFSDDDIAHIKSELDSGVKGIDLAKKYNVHRTTISKIKMGTYKV